MDDHSMRWFNHPCCVVPRALAHRLLCSSVCLPLPWSRCIVPRRHSYDCWLYDSWDLPQAFDLCSQSIIHSLTEVFRRYLAGNGRSFRVEFHDCFSVFDACSCGGPAVRRVAMRVCLSELDLSRRQSGKLHLDVTTQRSVVLGSRITFLVAHIIAECGESRLDCKRYYHCFLSPLCIFPVQ
jgi:hypothetical protein